MAIGSDPPSGFIADNSSTFNHKAQPSFITDVQQKEAPGQNLVLDKIFIGTILKSATTPNVKNVIRWKTVNTGPITITNFLKGQEGQEIIVLGDGHTSVADNATLKTGGGHLLSVNELYKFVLFNGIWYEE